MRLGNLYDREGNNWGAVTEYATIGYQSREYEAAVNYLDLLDQHTYTDDARNGLLLQVLQLDPGNIVAAYGLVAEQYAENDTIKAELVSQIQHFPTRQVYQSGRVGKRMSVHLASVVPELVDHDLWDLELASYVVDWWTRVGYYDAAEIASTGLLGKYPTNVAAKELVAQAYYENGEWGKAIAVSESILNVSPKSVAAYRYIAASYDAQGDSGMAGIWRRRYRELAADDWWDANLSPRLYESEIVKAVADMIGKSPADVMLAGNETP